MPELIWVYGEVVDGKISRATLEMLSKAAELGRAEAVLLGQAVAEGHGAVVSAENQIQTPPARPALAKRNGELVVLVAHLALRAEFICPDRVVSLPIRAHQNQAAFERRSAQKIQAQRRILEQGLLLVRHAVIGSDAREIRSMIRLELKKNR